VGTHADFRAAAVAFLKDYAASAGVKMQVYPARPRSIAPPTGFVDAINETIDHTTALTRRNPSVSVIVVHGIFDSMEAATQKDDYVDGIVVWADARYHQAGANTMLGISDSEDLPNYVPEWMPPAQQLVYYATRLTLEGLAGV
jgi:hypothetical protein